MKKTILALAVVFLCLFSAYAIVADIDLTIEELKSRVKPGENAEYNIIITNNEDMEMSGRIFVTGLYPAWIQSYKYTFDIEPNSEEIIPIKIGPTQGTKSNQYGFSVQGNVVMDGQQLTLPTRSFTIDVIGEDERFIGKATIEIYTEKHNFLPGEKVKVVVKVTDLKQVFVNPRADLKMYDEDGNPVYGYLLPVTSQVEPIVLIHDIPISERTPPGTYTISAELVAETGHVGKVSKEITVVSNEKPEMRRDVETNIFGTKASIYIQNLGNTRVDGEVRETIKSYERYLLTANPNPVIQQREDGDLDLVWVYEGLEAGGKSDEFTYSISYLPVYLGAALLLLLLLTLWQSTKNVTIKKEVLKQRISKNMLEATIGLHFKNLTNMPVGNVALVDRVPPLAQPLSYGTSKPKHVKKDRKGTVLEWDFTELAPNEERFITYKIKTDFGIVGLIDLPPALIRFTAEGKKQGIRSNPVECGQV